jgi:hypothetical protein
MLKNNPNLKQQVLFVLLLLIYLFTVLKLHGQVTIGSLTKPEKGALLEIKNVEATHPVSTTDNSNVTVDANGGGVGLPRVYLVNKYTLEPFIATGDAEWTNNDLTKISERHAGLMVYNIYVSPDTESDPDKMFRQGIYVWNGNRWREAGSGQEHFFYLPPVALQVAATGDYSVDLYDEYKKQYARISNRLYAREELDYVVTYYDETVLQVNRITADGNMSYTVVNLPEQTPNPLVLIHIVLLTK